MNKIDQIKQTVKIRDLASKFGANPNNAGKCKFNPLRQEKTCSLQIYDDTNSYKDFGGNGGSVIDFMMELKSCDVVTAINELCSLYNINTDNNDIQTIEYKANVPSKEYMTPTAVLKAFSHYKQELKISKHKEIITSIVPEYVLNQSNENDKIEFFNIVKVARPDEKETAVVLLPDYKGVSHTFRYRYKEVAEKMEKWIPLYGTTSNYAYCRFNENPITLIVEGTRDFLSALLCGYSVVAIPSAGFKNVSNEWLQNRTCIFIDDDDGKNSMIELYENTICEKIFFNHKKFKEITKCNSKDLSDYLYQFDNLETFKTTFENFIKESKPMSIDWENSIDKIAKSVTKTVIEDAENTEWLIDDALIKGNITTIVGAPNVGKSAFSFACTNRLFKYEKINKLLYFDADNPISYVKDRILKLINDYGEDKIKYYNGLNSSPKEMNEILSMLSTVKGGGEKVLIVIDSLKFFLNGSMNEDKIVSPFYDTLKTVRDRFKATIIVLHHTRKSKDDEGKLTYNGSQSVESSTDNMIMLTKDKIYHKKSRSDKSGIGFAFSLNFSSMDFTITETDDEIENEDNDKNDVCEEIKKFLLSNGESNTTQIINGLKGICGTNKVQNTLRNKSHNKIHWYCYKNQESKNEWLFKAIEPKINYDEPPQIIEFNEDEFAHFDMF